MDIASVLIFSGYGPVYRHKNSPINLWESVHLKFPYAQQLPQKNRMKRGSSYSSGAMGQMVKSHPKKPSPLPH